MDILLSIVQNHQRFSSIVTALSVQALDTCIETVYLKKDFLKSDGIGCLCGVLKTSFTGNVSDALIISKSILVSYLYTMLFSFNPPYYLFSYLFV